MSLSKSNQSVFVRTLLLLLLVLTAGCSPTAGNGIANNPDGYAILAERGDDEFAVKWQEYLFRQLSNRAGKAFTISKKPDPKLFTIVIGQAGEKDGSYCINAEENRLTIRAADEPTMVWVLYQLLKTVGERDPRLRAADLPPAIIPLQEKCGTFAFEYRDPYFAPNLDYDYSGILGTNNVERDWGIWGHGLKKVLTQDPQGDVFALVDGKRNPAQYCASAPAVFNQIAGYILNEYGDGHKQSYRFAILPNDNSLVCMCPRCRQAGNAPENATPAFTALITALANRFPKHQFFTSAYLTTRRPPDSKLPENAGVLVSAIDLPLGTSYAGEPATRAFVNTLQQWKAKTTHLYVWDYGSNYDDYFTPFPMLYTLQKRLRLFRENGVKGVFLNGSGYEFTTFEDAKTFVAAALMMNPDLSVDKLCSEFFRQQYPVSGKMLSDYYLGLEARAAQKKQPLPLYSGLRGLAAVYFDVPEFVKFYDRLLALAPKTDEEERARVNKILAALSFTRLQAARLQGVQQYGFLTRQGETVQAAPASVSEILDLLESGIAHFGNLRQYSESERLTADYVAAWHTALNAPADTNFLLGKTLTALSTPDEEYRNLKMLNDGVHGFEMDYHDGWVLAGSDDMRYRLPNDGPKKGKFLMVSFLEAPQYNIYLPSSVTIGAEDQQTQGKLVGHQKTGNITTYKIDISNLAGNTLRFEAFRQRKTGKSILACDEIILN